MGIGKDTYNKTLVGKLETVRATRGVTVGGPAGPYDHFQQFQLVVTELEDLESAGLIEIELLHKESSTGRHLVDLVTFRKLK